MKKSLHFFLTFLAFFAVTISFSQSKSWTKNTINVDGETLSQFHLVPTKVKTYSFNSNILSQRIQAAPLRGESKTISNTIVEVPTFDGTFEQFRIYEAPVFTKSLSERYPEIKSYVGFGVNNPTTHLRMSVSPQGVQTMISYVGKETVFMQPVSHGSNDYIVYTKSSRGSYVDEFVCSTIDELANSENDISSEMSRDADDQTLRTYRIAISVTGEYTQYHGGTVAGALAAINATLTRVNAVFETDMAISFSLVDANQVIYTNPGTDPYSSIGNWNSELQSTLTANVGEANYDIGHLFGGSGGGGNAGCIGCVCEDNIKGRGITSPADGIPETDTFDIDYVAHEIGHQMGANHTFSMNTEGTGVNVEPGSGSTIMGYAGITGSNDVQQHSDGYFHYASINQILNNVASAPNNCAVTTAISNNPPVAEAGPNYTIPKGTAFILRGSATDADGGDTLTYCWEQNNSAQVTSANFGPTNPTGALARSLPPTTSPDRYIPKLERVLNNQLTQTNPGSGSDWETISTVGRVMQWALTVRDRDASATGLNGQSSFDLMNMAVNSTAGPFVVTSQTDGALWTSGTNEMITWDVAGTTGNNVNTSNVNILLSTDGGQNFDTVLAANTPNDGSEMITVPNMPAPYCRIMIEPVGNIYYAINSAEFPLDYMVSTTCTQYASGPVNTPIPDGLAANTPGPAAFDLINVPDSNSISEVKVNVDIAHTYINDLVIQLQHPNGSSFTNVWNRNCAQQNDIDVLFEDGAPSIVCAEPTTGTYSPASPLSVFNGLDSAGDWAIVAVDYWNADTGTINDWYLEICSTTETPLSVDENTFAGFSIFPNPNNGMFTVKFNSLTNEDISIEVLDIRGRSIYQEIYQDSGSVFNQNIDLRNVQSGIYMVRASVGNRAITKKIIID
jgi:subtilisin-like proprotein convertase family protein